MKKITQRFMFVFLFLLAACTSTQVQDSIKVAIQIDQAAAMILMPVNPVLGGHLATVGSMLGDVNLAYSTYLKADAASKGQRAGEVRAIVATVQAHLSAILADARIKNPERVQYITTAAAIINSTVILVLDHLPPGQPGPPVVQAGIAAREPLPVVPEGIKSTKQAKQLWNSQAGLPVNAKVN